MLRCTRPWRCAHTPGIDTAIAHQYVKRFGTKHVAPFFGREGWRVKGAAHTTATFSRLYQRNVELNHRSLEHPLAESRRVTSLFSDGTDSTDVVLTVPTRVEPRRQTASGLESAKRLAVHTVRFGSPLISGDHGHFSLASRVNAWRNNIPRSMIFDTSISETNIPALSSDRPNSWPLQASTAWHSSSVTPQSTLSFRRLAR